MAGMTRHGLTIKRQGEVIADLKERAIPIFQDLVAPGDFVDTSDDSTIGRIIGLNSLPLADLWEAVQEVYLSFDPNSARGIALDNLVALAGIERFSQRNTRADVYLRAMNNTYLNQGVLARSNETGVSYALVRDVEIDSDNSYGIRVSVRQLLPNNYYRIGFRMGTNPEGQYVFSGYTSSGSPEEIDVLEGLRDEINGSQTSITSEIVDDELYVHGVADFQLIGWTVDVNLQIESVVGVGSVEATQFGDYDQPAGSIDTIATPTYGWYEVYNPLPAIPGRERETDSELRIRFRNSKFQRASNLIESLYTELIGISGIEHLIIYENDTDVVDENGLPPHSFHVIISGGLETEVARAIWNNRPAGILSVGTTTIEILDSHGYQRDVSFSRPNPVDVYVKMTLTTGSKFPENGTDEIKLAVENYINNLGISEDLVYSRLYTPINSVPGHQVDSMEISLDGENWQTSNISAGIDETLVTSIEKITIS